MNIYKHELRLYMKSTLIWTASLVTVVIFFVSIFPSFSESAVAMNKILDAFPSGLKNALGLSSMDLSSVIGFFGFMLSYIILIAGVQAMNIGLSILSNEQREKTADFLIAKPVKRIQIVHAKVLAGLTLLIMTNLIFFGVTLISVLSIADESVSSKVLLLFLGSLFFIQLFFMAFGMLLSVYMDKLKTVIPVSLGVVFGFFIINLLNESIAGKPLKVLTPFAYFNTSFIYDHVSYDLPWFILNLILVVVFTIGAYLKYIKKDVPSV